ncbi:phage protein Gp36 family protein [Flavobacterium caeni]|uniref:DUF1320 domain-containing protein n=1 Tax=Flavobacterium caeni TaxID=490189 RepID=A0A1G5K3G1_9FLAO|nr:phage protein Gp36 family protein [Flavobacterium caeni]SCY94558.1 Protein of unknown function [Flavobacterium caeni]
MFLTQQELSTVSTDQIINAIVNRDTQIVEDIIGESIDVMSTYLHQYFDTNAIFQATGDQRSKTILKHLKAIVKHELYSRRSSTMNEVVKDAHAEAMTWLEKVSKGEIKPALPPRIVDTDDDGIPDSEVPFLKLGSRRPYENRF